MEILIFRGPGTGNIDFCEVLGGPGGVQGARVFYGSRILEVWRAKILILEVWRAKILIFRGPES